MPGRDIILIGASAGALEGILTLAQELPRELPASVFIVVHTSPSNPSILPVMLSRKGALLAERASNRQPIQPGGAQAGKCGTHQLAREYENRATDCERRGEVFRAMLVSWQDRFPGTLHGAVDHEGALEQEGAVDQERGVDRDRREGQGGCPGGQEPPLARRAAMRPARGAD